MTIQAAQRRIDTAQHLANTQRLLEDQTDCHLDAVLHSNQRHDTFVGRIGRTSAIFQQFHGPQASDRVTKMQAELDLIAGHFGDGAFQTNHCLRALPDIGVIALSSVPGPALDEMIATADPTSRAQLITFSAQWLAAYTAPRQRQSTFGPRFWIKQLNRISLRGMIDDDKALFAALLDNLRAQAKVIQGCAVVQAASHGDFTGAHLHFHQGILSATGIKGENWVPRARDAAKFLVWTQIHTQAPPNDAVFGMTTDDIGAFLASGVIDDHEIQTTLPFFIAAQLYERFAELYAHPAQRDAARHAITSYLADVATPSS